MAQFQFDANSVAPDTGVMDPLPAGWYNVMMDESEIKPTNDGTGAYIKTRFKVISGHYTGRVIYTNFNVRNKNPVAQEIAYKQLSAVCHAVNVLNMQDTVELHGKPLKLKLKVNVRAGEGGYEASNDIKAYRNINEQVATNENQVALVIPPSKDAPAAGGAGFGSGGAAPAPGFGAGFGAPAAPAAPAQAFPGFNVPQQPQQQAPVQVAPPVQQPQQTFKAPPQQAWQQAPVQQPAVPQVDPSNPATWPTQPQQAPQQPQQPQAVPQGAAPAFAVPGAAQAPAAPVQQAPAPAAAPAPAPFQPGVPSWAQPAPQ